MQLLLFQEGEHFLIVLLHVSQISSFLEMQDHFPINILLLKTYVQMYFIDVLASIFNIE